MIVRCLIIFLASLCSQGADENAYTVFVPAGKTECYSSSVTDRKYQAIEIDFQVVHGGELDITFYILSPKELRVINDIKHNFGTHRVDMNMTSAGYGDYTFCFDNTFSIHSDKRVFFELFYLNENGNFLGGFDEKINVGAEVLKTLNTHIDNFHKATTFVKNNLNTIERLQKQYASTEQADRATVEQNYNMVSFWSIVHLTVMLFAAAVQVYMIRSLFEDSSRIGTILRKGRLNN